MGVISAAKGVTQLSNGAEMAGPAQMMQLADEVTRLIGESVETLSALPAAGSLLNGALNWPGRTVYVEDIDDVAIWDGAEWERRFTNDSGWVLLETFGLNWAATVGHPPRLRKIGNRVDIFGAVTWSLGANTEHILTIPAPFRPSGPYVQQFVASGTTNRGHSFTLFIPASTPDKLTMPAGYFQGSFTSPEVLPLLGGWYTD